MNFEKEKYGGTMRLGDWFCKIKKGTIAYNAYLNFSKDRVLSSKGSNIIVLERYRHRYEVNPKFHRILKDKGLIFSGTSKNGTLAEIIEFPQKIHPFFLGVQFHPEFKSRFLHPHPLFVEFIKNAVTSNLKFFS